MSVYSLDGEVFIGEIEKRPVIWDLNNEDNRHKNRKQQAWDEIARNAIPGFDDMNKTEKFEIQRRLHGKWRNIRDSYVRNMKKRPGQKRYMYAKHLAFLSNVYKTSDKIQPDEDEWSECDSKKLSNSHTYTDVEYWQDSDNEESGRKKLKEEDNPLDYIETPLIEETSTSSNFPLEDEDRSFFDSLLPAVRGFDIDQKLEFRSEVISLIKKIRSG